MYKVMVMSNFQNSLHSMGNFTSKNWEEMTEMTEAQNEKEEAMVCEESVEQDSPLLNCSDTFRT